MKILFISRMYKPHIGGVEKHVEEVSKELIKKGHEVTVLTEKYEKGLPSTETVDDIKIVRFSYPNIKIFGLLHIWFEVFKRRDLIKDADVIHIHDVFVWYLPFKFLYPFKKVYTTIHGWEGVWPIPDKNILLKRIGAYLSDGSISIGKYINKYYGIKSDMVMYGGTPVVNKKYKKTKNKVVYVGRLEKDTGLLNFLKDMEPYEYRNVTFVGDGPLRQECEKYGKVVGFTNPLPYYKTAEYAVPAGYLSYIEAKAYGCEIITFADNPLKKDYWNEIKAVKNFPTWSEVANKYLDLYQSK